MSEEILPDVVTAKTSKAVWDTLQRQFASATRAHTVQIRVELATTKKRDLLAADYFRKVKGLATELAVADAGHAADEVIAYLLAGLGPDYDPFVTSVTIRDEALTLDAVYAHLMAFEARQLQHQATLQFNTNVAAHYAGRGGPQLNRDGSPPVHRGGGRHRGRGRSSRGGRTPGDRQGFSSRPPCQICGKTSHTAVRCWYRMDESYNEDPPSAAVATTTSYKVDPNWYNDTGATDHITSDLDRLAVRERYHGGDQVQVGNGAGLCILHTCHSVLNTATRPLALRNILHVPDISKNLLSVHKFSRDNDVFFELSSVAFLC
jgi:hypothetical protein